MMNTVSRDQRNRKRRESSRPSSTSSNTATAPRTHRRDCRTRLSRCATRIAAASRAIARSGLPGDVQPLEPATPRLDVFISLIIALVGYAESFDSGALPGGDGGGVRGATPLDGAYFRDDRGRRADLGEGGGSICRCLTARPGDDVILGPDLYLAGSPDDSDVKLDCERRRG